MSSIYETDFYRAEDWAMSSIYETDFYRWTQETAELLRQRRFSEVDLEALIDEVEEMGRSRPRELNSRLSKLLAYLLKW